MRVVVMLLGHDLQDAEALKTKNAANRKLIFKRAKQYSGEYVYMFVCSLYCSYQLDIQWRIPESLQGNPEHAAPGGALCYLRVGETNEYTDADMDEIREEWVSYVSNFIFKFCIKTLVCLRIVF